MTSTSSLLISFFFLLLPCLSTGQVFNRNITLGSSLSTRDQNRSWVSPSGDFAFGFYPAPASNLFMLAIWFEKIPEKTVVWTARAGSGNLLQVQPGSTVRIAEDGRLLVQNQLGQEIWSAGPSAQDFTSAAMHDTGNFVLTGRNSTDIRWQSFDSPTDTILPTQILNKGSILSARQTQTDFSTGRYQLRMQKDGNLVLYNNTVALPTGFTYSAYWHTWNASTGPASELVFDASGMLSLTMEKNESFGRVLQLTVNSPTGPNFYHRATLDYNGFFRKYIFPRNGSNGGRGQSWSAVWSVPEPNLSSPLSPPLPRDPRSKNKDGLILAISVLLGCSAFANIICLAAVALILFPSRKRLLKPQPCSVNQQSNLILFSYKEIVQATNGFMEELGRGAFGSVYKGSLPGDSSTSVAVKRLDKVMQEGLKEFQTEVRTISRIHHKNLVPLLGFCDEGAHRMLVYEFMSNGSLASFLFSNPVRPSWDTRMQIAFGIARGLVYLHEECSTQIIHCDIKPENILLDEHFTARISDFGLAKLLQTGQSRTITGIRGTKGYVAPEWFKRMAITAKVDVYSYGVMLLEIICCRKNVGMEIEEEERTVLTDWAYDCYSERRLDLLVEDDEEAMNGVKTVERLVKVAMWCIQEDPSLRPQMKKVSQMLEGTVEVAVPPNPSTFISSLD